MNSFRIQVFSFIIGASIVFLWTTENFLTKRQTLSINTMAYRKEHQGNQSMQNSALSVNQIIMADNYTTQAIEKTPHLVETTPEPRIDKNVSLIHLLSYQRSGSSFAGGLIHTHPNAFFIYEPMDMLYSAMYGISPGWSVPADIFYTPNGRLRDIPKVEIDLSVWTIEQIFNCTMSNFPISMLLHRFWETFQTYMPDATPYVECMKRKKAVLETTSKLSFGLLHSVCPDRFDPNDRRLKICIQVLYNKGKWLSNETETDLIRELTPSQKRKLREYFRVLQRYSSTAKQCAKAFLDKRCAKKTIRGVKTVRSSIDVSTKLLERYSGTRVIHLLRDPRGVTRSRQMATWSHGLREGADIKSRSERYCLAATRDYKELLRLKSKYPGRAVEVVYDSFVQNPDAETKKIYQIIGQQVSESTVDWLKESSAKAIAAKKEQERKYPKMGTKTNSMADISNQWKAYFSPTQLRMLQDSCRELFQAVDYLWIR